MTAPTRFSGAIRTAPGAASLIWVGGHHHRGVGVGGTNDLLLRVGATIVSLLSNDLTGCALDVVDPGSIYVEYHSAVETGSEDRHLCE
jgi:hypothetical protein